MALRIAELIVPDKKAEEAENILVEHNHQYYWKDKLEDGSFRYRVLLESERTESTVDELEKEFGYLTDFRVLLMPLDATLPRIEQIEPRKEEPGEPPKINRISREELYSQVAKATQTTNIYYVMVILSTIVAAMGLIKDNTAVIIGAMVIAPLLGPNMALSLGSTLGDNKLISNALKANIQGVLLAFVVSILAGLFFTIDPANYEIASRTKVDTGDVILGLTSGIAGALAFTSGLSAAVIGVMVAVALLPPLVAVGLLIGTGLYEMAGFAFMLLLINIICVNLSGVVTFLVQGIRPLTWWELKKAKRATYISIATWSVLLLILIGLIIFMTQQVPE